jgi:hypothetical protein
MSIACAVAGGDPLGLESKSGLVVYINAEDSEVIVRNRIFAIGKNCYRSALRIGEFPCRLLRTKIITSPKLRFQDFQRWFLLLHLGFFNLTHTNLYPPFS